MEIMGEQIKQTRLRRNLSVAQVSKKAKQMPQYEQPKQAPQMNYQQPMQAPQQPKQPMQAPQQPKQAPQPQAAPVQSAPKAPKKGKKSDVEINMIDL